MQLEPCSQCRRHVERAAVRCPFCAAPQAAAAARRLASHAGRMSRAAVFAGAAACGSSAPPPHGPPPPPDPVVVQQLADEPTPVAGKARIRGFLTVDGRALAGIAVHATHEDDTRHQTTTGPQGEYSFIDIEPGVWTLTVDYELPPDRPQDPVGPVRRYVDLARGADQRFDIELSSAPPQLRDVAPCCKPYGAPPARRRVV
jgi:hypothetical protein